MATFVILSRISPEAIDDPKDFKKLAEAVSERIKQQCPGVTWKESYATLGRFDVVDIVEAADAKECSRIPSGSFCQKKRGVAWRGAAS